MIVACKRVAFTERKEFAVLHVSRNHPPSGWRKRPSRSFQNSAVCMQPLADFCRFLPRRVGQFSAEGNQRIHQFFVCNGHNLDGEESCIAGIVYADGCHRNTSRHLHNGVECILSTELFVKDGYADDRQFSHGGRHAGKGARRRLLRL